MNTALLLTTMPHFDMAMDWTRRDADYEQLGTYNGYALDGIYTARVAERIPKAYNGTAQRALGYTIGSCDLEGFEVRVWLSERTAIRVWGTKRVDGESVLRRNAITLLRAAGLAEARKRLDQGDTGRTEWIHVPISSE